MWFLNFTAPTVSLWTLPGDSEENGLGVDEEGFREKMKEHQNLAREDYQSKQGSAWVMIFIQSLTKALKRSFWIYGK